MPCGAMNRYLIAAIMILAGISVWSFWPKHTPAIGESAPLPPAKEVKATEKVRTEIKYVYVYPDKVKPKLNLPPNVVSDKSKVVSATGKIKADERPYTLSAVLDTSTGESEIFARPDPLPWIAPGSKTTVGIAYGLHNGETTGKLYAKRDLLLVKALHSGVTAELDQRGDWFAGGFVEIRF